MEKYITPEMETVEFDAEDVIAASGSCGQNVMNCSDDDYCYSDNCVGYICKLGG